MWAIKFTGTADYKGNRKKGKQLKILSQLLLLVWFGAKPGVAAGLSTGRDRINHAGDQPEPVGCVALHFANACLFSLEWSSVCGVAFVLFIRKF